MAVALLPTMLRARLIPVIALFAMLGLAAPAALAQKRQSRNLAGGKKQNAKLDKQRMAKERAKKGSGGRATATGFLPRPGAAGTTARAKPQRGSGGMLSSAMAARTGGGGGMRTMASSTTKVRRMKPQRRVAKRITKSRTRVASARRIKPSRSRASSKRRQQEAGEAGMAPGLADQGMDPSGGDADAGDYDPSQADQLDQALDAQYGGTPEGVKKRSKLGTFARKVGKWTLVVGVVAAAAAGGAIFIGPAVAGIIGFGAAGGAAGGTALFGGLLGAGVSGGVINQIFNVRKERTQQQMMIASNDGPADGSRLGPNAIKALIAQKNGFGAGDSAPAKNPFDDGPFDGPPGFNN